MAITLDKSLGSATVGTLNDGGALAITTGQVAAAGSRIVVCVSNSSIATVSDTVSDSGGSYTLDKFVTNGSDFFRVYSRVLVGSLASGSAITFTTHSGGPTGGVLLGAVSYLGTTGVDTTSSNTTTLLPFSSGAAANSVADALFVGGAGCEAVATSVGGTNTNGTSRFDLYEVSSAQGMRMLDKIVTSVASQALTGTWGSSSTATTGALVIYRGISLAAPTTRDRVLLRGVRDATAIAHMRMRQPVIPPSQTQPIGIWLPASPFPAARARSFFVVRGRQVKAVPVQEAPIVEQRSPGVRREPPRQSRGARAFPVQPQVPVPPTVVGNRINSERGKIGSAQRGRQWTVPLQVVSVVSSWVPQRTVPKHLLTSLVKGKRTTSLPDQSPPQARAAVRARISGAQRARRIVSPSQDAVIGQTYPHLRDHRRFPSVRKGRQAVVVATQAVVAAPSWVPQRPAPKRLLAAVGKGKRASSLPDQVPPPTRATIRARLLVAQRAKRIAVQSQDAAVVQSSPRTRGRFPAVRKGRQAVVVATQTIVAAPSWVPQRAIPKRLLTAVGKGRRTPSVSDQALPQARTAARTRLSPAVRKGRQAVVVATQAVVAAPSWVPQRTVPKRLLAAAGKGKRTLGFADQGQPQAKATPRTRFPAVRKGRQAVVVATQTAAAPPSYPPTKLGAARRLLSGAQRGRQFVTVPAQIVATAPAWVPTRTNVRKAFAAVQRGRGRVVPTDQPTPVRTALRRSQITTGRIRVLRNLPGQVHPPVRVARTVRDRIVPGRRGKQSVTIPAQVVAVAPTWVPVRIASHRLFAVVQRGRRAMPNLPQVPVPILVVPRTVGKWRWDGLRKGRQATPVPPQVSVPILVIPRTVAKWRWDGLRKGRQAAPVPPQAAGLGFTAPASAVRIRTSAVQTSVSSQLNAPAARVSARTLPPTATASSTATSPAAPVRVRSRAPSATVTANVTSSTGQVQVRTGRVAPGFVTTALTSVVRTRTFSPTPFSTSTLAASTAQARVRTTPSVLLASSTFASKTAQVRVNVQLATVSGRIAAAVPASRIRITAGALAFSASAGPIPIIVSVGTTAPRVTYGVTQSHSVTGTTAPLFTYGTTHGRADKGVTSPHPSPRVVVN